MARIMVYLTDAELAFVKSKPRGFVRKLVAGSMDPRVVTSEKSLADLDRKAKELGFEDVRDVPFSGTCPDCGEKIRMRGQPHGCRGRA